MNISQIKEYLRIEKMEFDEDVLLQLKELKEKAVQEKNEKKANEIWVLETVSKIQQMYLRVFNLLKEGKYENYFKAWTVLEQIEIEFTFLNGVYQYSFEEYHLGFIATMIREYAKLFPYEYFMSRESIVKKKHCSICGKVNTIRDHCKHKKGQVYMGELCCEVVDDFEFLGMAIVKNPFDRYTVLFPEGKEYNYRMLEGLMERVHSPYAKWCVDIRDEKNPLYRNIGRNDKCPCQSGNKFKKCCLGTENMITRHHKIIFLQSEGVSATPLPFTMVGTWKN